MLPELWAMQTREQFLRFGLAVVVCLSVCLSRVVLTVVFEYSQVLFTKISCVNRLHIRAPLGLGLHYNCLAQELED